MIEPITTAEAFAKARATLGLKQAELAAALGVHPQTVSNYERGARPIDLRSALALECLLHRHAAARSH